MSSNNVFLFWTGSDNVLILLLRKLIYLHSNNGNNYKVHFLTLDNINKYISDIPLIFYQLKPSFQADFIRVCVICDYGGIWLDSDTIVLNNMADLFNIIESKNGFFIKENNRMICNGVFGSKPNTPLMIKWKNLLVSILNTPNIINDLNGKVKAKRNVLGATSLRDIIQAEPQLLHDYVKFNGLDNMYPVNWTSCVEEFILEPYDNCKIIERDFQPLIILVNSVYRYYENKTETEILEANNPLSYFINKSLQISRNL